MVTEVPIRAAVSIAEVAMGVGLATLVQQHVGGKQAPVITFAGGLLGLIALEYLRRGATSPEPIKPADGAQPGF